MEMSSSSRRHQNLAPRLPHNSFTVAARQVVELACQQAAQRRAAEVGPEHLLLGILGARGNLALDILMALRVDPVMVATLLEADLPPISAEWTTPVGIGPQAAQILNYATKESAHLGHSQVDALHLLMGLLYEHEGIASSVLLAMGLSLYDMRQCVLRRRPDINTFNASSAPKENSMGISPIFLIPLGIMLASGLALLFGPSSALIAPLTIMFITGGWVVSVCLHEFGHALAAYLGGDESVSEAGYLTLNPLKYTHPLLSIVLPLLFLAAGGIGLPGGAVYINPHALRSKRWEIITAAAGPIGTAIFGLLIMWPFFFDWSSWVTPQNQYFWPALAFLAFLQISAFMFNLIPLPPLDGFGIIAPHLPAAIRQRAQMFGNLLLLLFFVALMQGGAISELFWGQIFALANTLHIPINLVIEGRRQFAL